MSLPFFPVGRSRTAGNEAPGSGHRRNQMLATFACLLDELHTLGCFWGNCSLSAEADQDIGTEAAVAAWLEADRPGFPVEWSQAAVH